MSKKTNGVTKDGITAKGFFRLQINEDGKVVGDSGWRKNVVVNLGFQDYLSKGLGGITGSKSIAYAILGTGDVPGVTDTALAGEITSSNASVRCAVTPSVIDYSTVQFIFTLSSNIYDASKLIRNVGLIDVSAATTGTIFSGNTYTTSALATNQSVNGSYQIRFS